MVFYWWIIVSGQTIELNWMQIGDLPSICLLLCRCHLERSQACMQDLCQHKKKTLQGLQAPGRVDGTVSSVRAGVRSSRESIMAAGTYVPHVRKWRKNGPGVSPDVHGATGRFQISVHRVRV